MTRQEMEALIDSDDGRDPIVEVNGLRDALCECLELLRWREAGKEVPASSGNYLTYYDDPHGQRLYYLTAYSLYDRWVGRISGWRPIQGPGESEGQ